MRAEHFEFLVEEPSAEAFLTEVLPRVLGDEITFQIHVYQGKTDLLAQLQRRLRGYASWLPPTWRIVILIDRDQADCGVLKAQLEAAAAAANLSTRSTATGADWQVVSRLAIEELEAWYFGDWTSVVAAFPKASENTIRKAAYRHCDAIAGGTWEALERVLGKAGYFAGGLRKVEAARAIGERFDPGRCISPSFNCLRKALDEATEPAAE
jgi:hypothetical protein